MIGPFSTGFFMPLFAPITIYQSPKTMDLRLHRLPYAVFSWGLYWHFVHSPLGALPWASLPWDDTPPDIKRLVLRLAVVRGYKYKMIQEITSISARSVVIVNDSKQKRQWAECQNSWVWVGDLGPAIHRLAHRHMVIGPNNGINKPVKKGPTIVLPGVQTLPELQDRIFYLILASFYPRTFPPLLVLCLTM